MGAKQTKIEGTYLPETPKAANGASFATSYTVGAIGLDENIDIQDPRSPNVCRTPINIFTSNDKCAGEEKNVKTNRDAESTVGQLRRRFLKGFTYNLNDPRSPAHQFNRSPLCFDDSQDKILNLNDTFSDLFAEPQSQCKVTEEKITNVLPLATNVVDAKEDFPQKEQIKIIEKLTYEEFACDDEKSVSNTQAVEAVEDIKETSIEVVEDSFSVEKEDLDLHNSPLPPFTLKILQDERDPRSPTIGVDRTPIIFSDDEANEGVLLESILATLSLDMSDTSICSIPTSNQKTTTRDETNRTDRQGQLFRKITHKRMRRGQGNEKIPLVTTRRITRELESTPQRVFEDSENEPNLNVAKSQKLKQKNENGIKRTPLSCLKNSNLNSRMSTDKTKLIKTRLEYATDEGVNIISGMNCKSSSLTGNN